MLPFDESNEEDGHDSDFENSPDPEEDTELDLDEELILFEDDNPNLDSKPEEGTSFIDIEEYLAHVALMEPLELPPAKIPELPSDAPTLKSRGYYDDGTRI